MVANRAPHQAQSATRRSRVRFSVLVDIAASLLGSSVDYAAPYRSVPRRRRIRPVRSVRSAPTIGVSDTVHRASRRRASGNPRACPESPSLENGTSMYRPLGALAPRVSPPASEAPRLGAVGDVPRSGPAPWRGVLVGGRASRRSARRSRPAATARSWTDEAPPLSWLSGNAELPRTRLGPRHRHIVDLNRLTGDDDWTLFEVWGVNDAGQIAGFGAHRIDGIYYQRAFLLGTHRHRRSPRPAR